MRGVLLDPLALQFNREREEMVDAQMNEARRWNRELRKIDPRLSLVMAKEGNHDLIAGAWHIKRKGEQWDAYLPWTDEEGNPLPPSSGILEMLRQSDLWAETYQQFRDKRRALERAREKAIRLEAEGRKDNMAAAVRAANRVSGDGGMTRRRWGKG